MDTPIRSLRDELRRLARAAEGSLLTVEGAATALGASSRTAALRLGALARSGWVVRVRRGIYHLPSIEAGATSGPEDPFVLADALFAPCYIGGWSAAEHWGLTEQLFTDTFVVTAANIRLRNQTALGARFRLVRVARARVESVPSIWRRHQRLRVSSPERTIADACADPSWVGGVRHLGQILDEYLHSQGADSSRVVAALREVGRGAAWKRAGILAECVWPDAKTLIDAALRARSTGVVRLDPAITGRGKLNRRWGLWINAELPKRNSDS